MKFVIVLFAVMAVASAFPGIPWAAPVHAPQVVHALQIPQQPAIPPVHPQPLNIKVHAVSSRIPYHSGGYVKPHLIGVEQYVEPVKVIKAAVHAPVHQPWD
ncbi:uncharacterized protein LOC143149212 isoform X2 [Ptiloglossa arizonensis]|uniref:uncharacterized protein LOC143149212 isoform X2 n=1 Tax=Ptiloglossa arizonensis TaxID=3350558 RepID=UPI003F9F71B5